ncbi:MAG: DMT family transporter [Bacillota bacterium]|nr:DMT family transporter [Bacillota bacterium]
MRNSGKGLILVLLSSLCYALTGLVSKILINIGLDPLVAVTMRNGGCCILLCLGLFFFNRKAFRVERRHWRDFFVVGLFMFIYSAAYFFALVYLDLSVAVILLYTYPSMVVIASVFIYKEPLHKTVVLALALTFLGLVLTLNFFSGNIGRLSPLGVALALFAAVGAAGFAICVKKISTQYGYSGATINFYCFLTTVLGYGVFLVFNPSETAPTLLDIGKISLSVIPYTLALLFYAGGLKFLSPAKVGIIGSTEPAFGIILSLRFLGEYISPSQWLGAAAILAAIFIVQIFAQRDEIPGNASVEK